MGKKRIGAIDEELYNKAKRYGELTGKSIVKTVEDVLSNFFQEYIIN